MSLRKRTGPCPDPRHKVAQGHESLELSILDQNGITMSASAMMGDPATRPDGYQLESNLDYCTEL